MRPRWSVIALGAALLICGAGPAEAGIVVPSLGTLGANWWSGAPAVMVGWPDFPAPLRVADFKASGWLAGEVWEESVGAAPEFGRLLAEVDLGPAWALDAGPPQVCDLGSVRAVVLDLAAGPELEELFAASSLPRKAPEPISVVVWVFLGLTWVGVRAMRRVRGAEFGRGLAGRRVVVRRPRWSDENRAAIRRIIESGLPR